MSVMGPLTRAQALSLQHPGMAAGRWAWTVTNGNVGNTAVVTANRITTYPWFCPRDLLVSNIFLTTNTGGAGSAIKPGIFASDPVTGLPTGTPVIAINAGIDTTVAETDVVAITPVQLVGGRWYWPFTKASATTPSLQGITSASGTVPLLTWPAATDASFLVLFVSDPYANDITTFNATGQSWSGSGSGTPCVGIGF
jgi:hypothetical protein